MKITATNQDATSAIATTQKMPPAYSPTAELAKPIGRKPAAVTSVPVSIGKAVEVQAKAAARMRSQPCSIFTTIISTAMIASSTSRPSAMIRAPSVMRCRSIPSTLITAKVMASTSGTESATTMPVRQPSDRNETRSTMPSASRKECSNSTDRVVDHLRLVGDLLDVDALRHRLHEGVRSRIHVLAEGQDVGALRHHDAEAERRLAALADKGVGRVLEAAGDRRDVAETEHAAARLDRGFGYRLRAVEGARDAQGDPLRAGLDGAGRERPRSAAAATRTGPAAGCPESRAWRG